MARIKLGLLAVTLLAAVTAFATQMSADPCGTTDEGEIQALCPPPAESQCCLYEGSATITINGIQYNQNEVVFGKSAN